MSLNNRFLDLIGKVSKDGPVKNQQTVLDELVKGICRSFESLVPGIIDRLLDALLVSSGAGETEKLRDSNQIHGLHSLIHRGRIDFQKSLNQKFEANLTVSLDNLAGAEFFWPSMRPDEIDKMLLIRNLATKLQVQYHDFLVELSDRLATVMGVSEISPGLNPMRPTLLVDSIYEAWQSLKVNHTASDDLCFLEQISPTVIGDLTPMYLDLIKILTNLNIEPSRGKVIGNQSGRSNSYPDVDAGAGSSQVDPATLQVSSHFSNVESKNSDSDSMQSAAPMTFFERLQKFARKFRIDSTSSDPPGDLGTALPDLPAGEISVNSAAGPENIAILQLLNHLMPHLPPVAAQSNVNVALRPTSSEALATLVGQSAKADFLTALDNLQSAQLSQPEKFREALSPDASLITDAEALRSDYVDPISPPDMVLGGSVKFVNVVRSIQQSDIGQTTNSLNASVIELVARVFDFVFQDKYLADSMKLLLSRLQIPILKAALLDISFFEKNDHPARLFVNTLASAGLGWQEADGQQSSLFVLIENSVNRVVSDFKEDLSLFQIAADEVSSFVKQQEEEAQRQSSTEREQAKLFATETENKELANRAARQVIEERLSERLTTPLVSNFLRQVWVKYVCHLLLLAQNDTTQLSTAVVTADDLLWSVEPKNDRLQRIRLLAKLPVIESQIKTGVAHIEWPSECSQAFFRDLDDRWAGAMIGEPLLPLDATQTANNPVTDSINDIAAEDEDPAIELVMQLEPGAKLELMKDDGALFSYKLGWVSEAKTRFLLTNRLNSAPLIVTAKYLAEHYRLGKMRLMDREPLMDRVMGNILDALEETRYPEEMMHQTGTY